MSESFLLPRGSRKMSCLIRTILIWAGGDSGLRGICVHFGRGHSCQRAKDLEKKAFLAAFLNSVWQDAKDRNQTPDSFWIHHLQLVTYHCLCERHWASSVTRLLIFLVKCVFWRWTLDVLLDGQDLCQRFLNMVLKDKKQTHTCRYDR